MPYPIARPIKASKPQAFTTQKRTRIAPAQLLRADVVEAIEEISDEKAGWTISEPVSEREVDGNSTTTTRRALELDLGGLVGSARKMRGEFHRPSLLLLWSFLLPCLVLNGSVPLPPQLFLPSLSSFLPSPSLFSKPDSLSFSFLMQSTTQPSLSTTSSSPPSQQPTFSPTSLPLPPPHQPTLSLLLGLDLALTRRKMDGSSSERMGMERRSCPDARRRRRRERSSTREGAAAVEGMLWL